jgi:hypothetical protein
LQFYSSSSQLPPFGGHITLLSALLSLLSLSITTAQSNVLACGRVTAGWAEQPEASASPIASLHSTDFAPSRRPRVADGANPPFAIRRQNITRSIHLGSIRYRRRRNPHLNPQSTPRFEHRRPSLRHASHVLAQAANERAPRTYVGTVAVWPGSSHPMGFWHLASAQLHEVAKTPKSRGTYPHTGLCAIPLLENRFETHAQDIFHSHLPCTFSSRFARLGSAPPWTFPHLCFVYPPRLKV